MFVGSKGKILAGFQFEDPHLILPGKMPEDLVAPVCVQGQRGAVPMSQWSGAVRGGPQLPSSFLNARPISEAVSLYAVALRIPLRRSTSEHHLCGRG